MPRSRKGRFNGRTLVVMASIALPVVWFGNAFVEAVVFGGIHHHDGYADVDLQALGRFPFNSEHGTIQDVPSKFRLLDGQRIVTTGFMYSGTGAGLRVHDFEFVYNVQSCCFGGPPKVQERIFARCPDKKSILYTNDFRRLTGILHVKPETDPETGAVKSVYTMDVEKSEPVKGWFFGLFN